MTTKKSLKKQEIIELIDKTKFFQYFTDHERQTIVNCRSSFVHIQEGVTFIEEGKIGVCLYVLLSGKVIIEKQNLELVCLNAGEIIGEMAFLSNTVRTTTVIAAEDILVLRIDQDLMKQLGGRIRERIKDQCIRKLVERIKKTRKRLTIHGLI